MKDILSDKSSRQVAISDRDNLLWEKLRETSILSAADAYLNSMGNKGTRYMYRCYFNGFFREGLLNPRQNLQFLSLANVDAIGDEIRRRSVGCEGTKQTKVAAYIGFTSYLERTTQGMIRKMKPCKTSGSETFKRLRMKSATEALTELQCEKFIHGVSDKCFRMGLIVKMLLQGAKRVSEVLEARIENIDWSKGTILFNQKKCKVGDGCTVITFPQSYLNELRAYVGDRESGLIFITRNGKKISSNHLYIFFVGVSVSIKLPIKVTPHVLRASAITILSQKGVSSDAIMKVSGHASPAQVVYYDKTSREENVSKEYTLI